jgi:vesicle-associated membrane protein 7
MASAPSEYAGEASSSAGGLTFMVIASSSFGRRVPFGYLVEIKNRFLARYRPETTQFGELPAYGCAAFNAELKALMVEYGTTQKGQEDAIGKAQSEIENVRGIMTENIERVLERGERIDLLVDKTDRLGTGAHDFRMRSRGLRRRMWWKNVKLMVLLVVVIIFLVYLFVGFGCGLPSKWALFDRRVELVLTAPVFSLVQVHVEEVGQRRAERCERSVEFGYCLNRYTS